MWLLKDRASRRPEETQKTNETRNSAGAPVGDSVTRLRSGPGENLLRTLKQFGEKPGLARIEFLLDRLGLPQQALPAIHVGGTNGKGSTAAMIEAILRAAGLRVGLFTSPHLIRYNERIVVDGKPITDEALQALLDAVGPFAAEAVADPDVGQPTEFEVATAAALVHFAEERIDAAVVEVGLGGRLDSTNVVHPVVSVITPVGLDHTTVLGSTLAEIAADKSGILRSGVPLVLAKQPREAAEVIRRRAQAVGAPLFEAGRDFESRLVHVDVTGTTFDLRSVDRAGRPDGPSSGLGVVFDRGGPVTLPLVGAHQADNAAVAVAAAEIALSRLNTRSTGGSGGTELDFERIVRTGLANARWPGRFEIIGEDPLTIVDGAHNAEAAAALAATVGSVLADRRIVFVIGMLAEKPVRQILEALAPLADELIFTKPSQGRTAPADPGDLAESARYLRPDARADINIEVWPDPIAAVTRARRRVGSGGAVLVCGSLYLVGEVKAALAGNLQSVGE